MSISIDRYVSIVSGVIGAQAVAQRELVGLRFTTSTRVPTDALVTVNNDGAADYFGATSPEAVFANQYFAYISPAPASQARSLRFIRLPLLTVHSGDTANQFDPITDVRAAACKIRPQYDRIGGDVPRWLVTHRARLEHDRRDG